MNRELEDIQRLQQLASIDKVKALELASKVVKSHRKSVHVNFLYGSLLRRNGHLEKSILQLEYTLGLKGMFAEALNELGQSCFGLGRVQQAIHYYNEAIKIKPDFPGALNNRGIAFQERNFSKRDLGEALRSFEDALKFVPNNPTILHNIGSCYREQGQLERAVEVYRQALCFDGNSAYVLQSIGLVYSKLGHKKKTYDYLEKAIKIDPKLYEARYTLAADAYLERN